MMIPYTIMDIIEKLRNCVSVPVHRKRSGTDVIGAQITVHMIPEMLSLIWFNQVSLS